MAKARGITAIILAWLLLAESGRGAQAEAIVGIPSPLQVAETAQNRPLSATPPSLDEVARLSSIEIAALAEKFSFDSKAINARIENLKAESKRRESTYKAAVKAGEKQIELKEQELAGLKGEDEQTAKTRKRIRCELVRDRKDLTEKTYTFLQSQISGDVVISKMNLLANWKSEHGQLEQRIASGTISQRPHGDAINIGNRSTRKPFKGQADDQKWGQKEIDEARARKLFPREISDPVLTEYVNRLAQNLARDSDLQVPLKTYLVQQELKKDGKPVIGKDGRPEQVANAMALPGGFLVIYAGVVMESENESELAGVIAHEMSHSAARHGSRLASKGKKFGIVQLAATIGLQIFAPGLFYAASYLSYYLKGLLLQAIFQGMGLVFTLDALGVNREFELEADQLGMQYAWKAGYDPEGFVRLFDHMSQKEGYASHTSFFATHPAFGDRVLNALKEYEALKAVDPDRQYLMDTSEFREVKERLRNELSTMAEVDRTGRDNPSLKTAEPDEEDCREYIPPGPTAKRAVCVAETGFAR